MDRAIKKSPSKIGAVFFAIGVFLVFLIVEGGIGFFGVIGYTVYLVVKSAAVGSAPLTDQAALTAMIMDSGALAILQNIATFAVTVISFVWYYFGYVKPEKAEGKNNPAAKKMKDLRSVGMIAFGAAASWTLAVVLQMTTSMLLPDAAEYLDTVMAGITSDSVLVNILLIVVMAPISEELFIRGIILRRAEKSFGLIGCMVLSTVMFAVFHMNPIQFIYVIPGGMLLGYVGVKYHSVIPCIIIHMINNGLSMIVPKLIDTEKYTWVYLIFAIVLGVIAFLCWKKVDFLHEPAQTEAEATEVEV